MGKIIISRETLHYTPGQVIRLYRGQNTVEFEWLIGPLPLQPANTPGLEVVTRYTTDLNSQDIFNTDSNGRFMISR